MSKPRFNNVKPKEYYLISNFPGGDSDIQNRIANMNKKEEREAKKQAKKQMKEEGRIL